jgi:hypothetical protein
MALTAWANLTIGTVDDVRARIADLAIPLAQSDAEAVERDVEIKMSLAKDVLFYDVTLAIQDSVPDTVEKWVAYALSMQDDARAIVQRTQEVNGDTSILPAWFSWGGIGHSITYITNPSGVRPRTFLTTSTPTNGVNGTYHGAADNGDMLVNAIARALYVNAGTLASPTWRVMDAYTLTNYIANPEVLRDPFVAQVILKMLEDGAMRFRAGYESNNDLLDKMLVYWDARYKAEIKRAVQLLRLDWSEDGTVSEFERVELRRSSWLA